MESSPETRGAPLKSSSMGLKLARSPQSPSNYNSEIESKDIGHNRLSVFSHDDAKAQHDDDVLEQACEMAKLEMLSGDYVSSFRIKSSSGQMISGFLKKKSPTIMRGWQTRFCILNGKKLSYYLSE
mmetsp:Transcript_14846/g.10742  ORF Transcript_14846/g.10742 Transcript_14846/m.10742 type:complete len:126 (-) Transcript_14846:925-1302(-)